MKAVGWMVAVSVISGLVAIAVFGKQTVPEIVLGMSPPLAVASGTWLLIERTHRRQPERVTPLMIAAFGVKLVLFGTYVAVIVKLTSLRPVPFIVSFAGYFIGLHLTEALFLRRLFMLPRAQQK